MSLLWMSKLVLDCLGCLQVYRQIGNLFPSSFLHMPVLVIAPRPVRTSRSIEIPMYARIVASIASSIPFHANVLDTLAVELGMNACTYQYTVSRTVVSPAIRIAAGAR